MCVSYRELFTVCAHICAAAAGKYQDAVPDQHCDDGIYVKCVFGWCPACTSRVGSVFHRWTRPRIELRDIRVLRRYWEYKSRHRLDVPSSAMPYEAFDPSQPLGLYNEVTCSPQEYTWEERAMERELRHSRPQKVWVGPRVFSCPLGPGDAREMLALARHCTLLWVRGDEMLYLQEIRAPVRSWLPNHPAAWLAIRIPHPSLDQLL